MKDVWHLFCSQVSALRWWLLVWFLALAAWTVARWTYLTTFRKSWDAQDDYCWYGLMALSALLVAAAVHLHPPGKRLAGWRAWPLRRWKTAAGQFLFAFVFLVLLPGAAEMVFLLHPKLHGFMGSGMTEWLTRSLWPLPVALGLAACSQSLRRFLLDALILTGIVIGSRALSNTRVFSTTEALYAFLSDKSYAVLHWFYLWLPACVMLVWVVICGRWISQRTGRTLLFLTPILCLGILAAVRGTRQKFSRADYAPSVTKDTELASRVHLHVSPEFLWIPRTLFPSDAEVTATVELEGLEPDEEARVTFWRKRLYGAGVVVAGESHAWEPIYSPFGDHSQKPWPDTNDASRMRMNVFTAPWEKLLELQGNPARLETTVMVTVQHSVELVRLPFRSGTKWEDANHEVTVEFIGPATEGARLGVRRLEADSPLVSSILCRQFGTGPSLGWVAEFSLVHKPTGFSLQTAGRNSLGGDWLSHSNTSRQTFGYEKGAEHWASNGLSRWALKHPQEFEFVVKKRNPNRHFVKDISVDGFRFPSAQTMAIPDMNRPHTVDDFLRELNDYRGRDRNVEIYFVLERCGPQILPALVEFSLRNPDSPLVSALNEYAPALTTLLFRPERQDHRMAFFRSFGRPGLFAGTVKKPPIDDSLLSSGVAWVKEDPDNRLTFSWLYQMRDEQVPALYPAIRRYLQKEGNRMPWRSWLHMPGLELPDIVDPPMVSVPRGPSPATESEFYRASATLTGPQESYREAVKQGKEWAPRVGSVIAASDVPEDVITLWLKVWPEVSDCPSDPKAARAWIQANADRLKFNPQTRRYEIR